MSYIHAWDSVVISWLYMIMINRIHNQMLQEFWILVVWQIGIRYRFWGFVTGTSHCNVTESTLSMRIQIFSRDHLSAIFSHVVQPGVVPQPIICGSIGWSTEFARCSYSVTKSHRQTHRDKHPIGPVTCQCHSLESLDLLQKFEVRPTVGLDSVPYLADKRLALQSSTCSYRFPASHCLSGTQSFWGR